METHKGIEKAVEERAKGLAKDQPLIVTQRNRTNTGGAMRQDTFLKLLTELADYHGNDHVRAAYNIAIGWRMRDNPATLKTSKRIWGGVGGLSENEISDYMLDCETRFKKWLDWTAIHRIIDCRNVAIRICAEGYTYESTAFDLQKDWRTIKRMCLDGVAAYVDANDERYVSPPLRDAQPEPPAFNITRIVQFVDEME